MFCGVFRTFTEGYGLDGEKQKNGGSRFMNRPIWVQLIEATAAAFII